MNWYYCLVINIEDMSTMVFMFCNVNERILLTNKNNLFIWLKRIMQFFSSFRLPYKWIQLLFEEIFLAIVTKMNKFSSKFFASQSFYNFTNNTMTTSVQERYILKSDINNTLFNYISKLYIDLCYFKQNINLNNFRKHKWIPVFKTFQIFNALEICKIIK